MSKPGKWVRLRDWGCEEILDMRHVGGHSYQFIRITDMDAACGRDNEGQDKYAADLSLVDLDALGPDVIDSALKCCGADPEDRTDWNGDPLTGDSIAEMCMDYGARAPLGEWSSNNWCKMLRDARREANDMLDILADAMERPVNRLGSTAAEYMRGDHYSAMERGVLAGEPGARIMAKMHGNSDELINDARPADWLPYFIGYMAGESGGEPETGDDLAPEYTLGYERGKRVRAGEATRPGWINTSAPAHP